jgi:hypothetical protein
MRASFGQKAFRLWGSVSHIYKMLSGIYIAFFFIRIIKANAYWGFAKSFEFLLFHLILQTVLL